MSRGFTLVELVICVTIFMLMTALLVAKYGNFNQSTLFTDTAYEIALVMRTAQNYGLSIKNSGVVCGSSSSSFTCPYGVDFNVQSGGNSCGQSTKSDAAHINLFAENSSSGGQCGPLDTVITTYMLTRGATITGLCAGAAANFCAVMGQLDVDFQRPDPDANICAAPISGGSLSCGLSYAAITITGSDGSTRTISVNQTGLIAVSQ